MRGACRLGDLALNPSDCCGCTSCCHVTIGPTVTGSSNVFINGLAVFRGSGMDMGVHSACCGSNTYVSSQCSSDVIVNGVGIVRLGDLDTCCGGISHMITASSDTFVN